MILWKRSFLLGLLSWLIPFFAGFLLFPVKHANAPLFETLMSLILLVTAGALIRLYFRVRSVAVFEALLVGTLWLGINLVLDYPMFAYGPMKMSAAGYYSEIGLGYLAFPIFALLAAKLVQPGPRAAS